MKLWSSIASASYIGISISIRRSSPEVYEWPGSAGGDVIDLFQIDANAQAAGNQAFAFDSTRAGGLSLVNSGQNTMLRGNTDNDAAFEFVVVIKDGAVSAGGYSSSESR